MSSFFFIKCRITESGEGIKVITELPQERQKQTRKALNSGQQRSAGNHHISIAGRPLDDGDGCQWVRAQGQAI